MQELETFFEKEGRLKRREVSSDSNPLETALQGTRQRVSDTVDTITPESGSAALPAIILAIVLITALAGTAIVIRRKR